MGDYCIAGAVTNTQSATLPSVTLMGHANTRVRLYDYMFFSGAAPAGNAYRYLIQRCTTAGTPGSSFVPVPLDPGDPDPGLATSGFAVFSAGPTLTANKFVGHFGGHMQAPVRWAPKDGKEIKIPATAANGVAWIPVEVPVAFSQAFSIQFEE